MGKEVHKQTRILTRNVECQELKFGYQLAEQYPEDLLITCLELLQSIDTDFSRVRAHCKERMASAEDMYKRQYIPNSYTTNEA